MKYNSKLLKCIRCPTAYHSGDFCVAAGTVQITAEQIVCPKHYEPPPPKKGSNWSHHVSTNWCFLCTKGGTLICCDRCPASFHADCLGIDTPSADSTWFCAHCESGRLPLYNEVVWVKLGHFRWWPAKVLHPTQVPLNIERLPHQTGEFPIQFCGSKEYYWMNQGRCFLFEEGDADRIPGGNSSSKGLQKSFLNGVYEAAELYAKYQLEKRKREEANANRVRCQKGLKPPLFTRIKTNRPVGDCPIYTQGNKLMGSNAFKD